MPLVQAPYPPGSGAVGALVPSAETVPPAISAAYPGGLFPVGFVTPSRETVPPAIAAAYPGGQLPAGALVPSRETVPPAVSAQYPGGLFPVGSTQPSRETVPPAISGGGVLTYAQQVIADGAVAYWRLGDPLGSGIAADSAGAGGDGDVQLPVTFGQPGAVAGNTAASFSGAGKITAENAVALPATGFTLEAWVKFPTAAGAALPILAGDMYMDGGFAWQIRGSNQSTVVFMDATAGTVYGQFLMSLNAWHHVVTTYDGTTIRHYVDGVADTAQAMAVNPTLGAQPAQIGCDFRNATFFAGVLDEIAIYQRNLTPAKILAHYNAR